MARRDQLASFELSVALYDHPDRRIERPKVPSGKALAEAAKAGIRAAFPLFGNDEVSVRASRTDK